MEIRKRQTDTKQMEAHVRPTRTHGTVGHHQQRPQTSWHELRGLHDHLRNHANNRNGERSSDGMFYV